MLLVLVLTAVTFPSRLTAEDIYELQAYHFILGSVVYSTDLTAGLKLQTLQGKNVTITVLNGTIYVNAAKIIDPDYLMVNGRVASYRYVSQSQVIYSTFCLPRRFIFSPCDFSITRARILSLKFDELLISRTRALNPNDTSARPPLSNNISTESSFVILIWSQYRCKSRHLHRRRNRRPLFHRPRNLPFPSSQASTARRRNPPT